jgi:hypothetical protein
VKSRIAYLEIVGAPLTGLAEMDDLRPTPQQVAAMFAGYDTRLLTSALEQWDRAFGASYSDVDRGQIVMAPVVIGVLRERLAEVCAHAQGD